MGNERGSGETKRDEEKVKLVTPVTLTCHVDDLMSAFEYGKHFCNSRVHCKGYPPTTYENEDGTKHPEESTANPFTQHSMPLSCPLRATQTVCARPGVFLSARHRRVQLLRHGE